jgi:hypothetical protein
MNTFQKKDWNPFRLVSESEYYSNLEKIQEFNKSIFGGLARYRGQKNSSLDHRAA